MADILVKMAVINLAVLFFISEEATFHVSGHVNKYNCVIWTNEHPCDIREHTHGSGHILWGFQVRNSKSLFLTHQISSPTHSLMWLLLT